MTINDAYKKILWKRVDRTRVGWERKFIPLVKKVLNKQFKDLADRIDVTNYRDEQLPFKLISKDPIEKMFIDIYKTVGTAFAEETYRQLKNKKADEPIDNWYRLMVNFAKTKAGLRIVSITESSREQALKIIRQYLEESTIEGWGSEETARAIRNGLTTEGIEMNQWRALRIARTEIVSASNEGAMMGARSTDENMEKFWLAVQDDRTRDTHAVVEEQNPKAMDETFTVGAYEMDYPGAMTGGPEEVINCRCTVYFNVKGL